VWYVDVVLSVPTNSFRESHQLPFFLLVYLTSLLESFMLVACKEFMCSPLTLFALISNSLIMWVTVVWIKCNGLLVAVCSLVCCSCGPSKLLLVTGAVL
jgi:hypothetical protein